MKNNIIKRAVSLLLALVCVVGVLPLSAFAATGLSSAPASGKVLTGQGGADGNAPPSGVSWRRKRRRSPRRPIPAC